MDCVQACPHLIYSFTIDESSCTSFDGYDFASEWKLVSVNGDTSPMSRIQKGEQSKLIAME
jgi:hypothetical protein